MEERQLTAKEVVLWAANQGNSLVVDAVIRTAVDLDEGLALLEELLEQKNEKAFCQVKECVDKKMTWINDLGRKVMKDAYMCFFKKALADGQLLIAMKIFLSEPELKLKPHLEYIQETGNKDFLRSYFENDRIGDHQKQTVRKLLSEI